MIFNIVVISVSLSIDALGIGIAYGLKGVKITKLAKVVIGLISAGVMWISLLVGNYINEVLPHEATNIIGIGILVLMGIIFIRNSLFSDEEASYDLDKSLNIDAFEAVILGFALSADSISTGIAIASIGIGSMWIPFLVGMMQILFLSAGCLLVKNCSFVKSLNSKVCGVFSGVLLIVIAILRSL